MKQLVITFIIACFLSSCNNNNTASSSTSANEEVFTSVYENGKYTTDFATAQELKSMRNTIENFTLLSNKRKLENLKAYQEFGDLMQMHTDRVTTYCRLNPETKGLLCKKLDKINAEVQTLRGDDMQQSKSALKNINKHLADIDSSFAYMN